MSHQGGTEKWNILNYKGQGCRELFKFHSGSARRGEEQEASQGAGRPEQ